MIAASFDRRARRTALDLLRRIVTLECETDPGTNCDIIVVNSDAGWACGNSYLESIDGTPTFAGQLRILRRDTFGGRYGAFNAAFETFRHEYRYWLFVRDVVIVTGDRYFARLIDRFDQQPNTGFVALHGIGKAGLRYARGGAGVSRGDVLDAVHRAWGSLPHRRLNETQDPESIFTWGEVMFTGVMTRMGYVLVDAPGFDLPPDSPEWRSLLSDIGRKRAPSNVHRWLMRCSKALENWADG